MSIEVYTLSDSGEKQTISCKGSLYVDLGNGTSLELLIQPSGRNQQKNSLAVFSRITGREEGETERDEEFSTLAIFPSAANVIDVSACLFRKSKTD